MLTHNYRVTPVRVDKNTLPVVSHLLYFKRYVQLCDIA